MRTLENYEQAIEFLFGRINYERVHTERYSARDFKLERMGHLLSLLGDPQNHIPVIHIAGTKGKGSTASMVAEILQAAGYRVGLFTSPHVEAFEERMRVNRRMPSPNQLVKLVNVIRPLVTQMDLTPGGWKPTYFEISTALAWLYFQQQKIDLAVLEVGLGGRLDSTNLCVPEVSVLTSISRDHTHLLGSTLAEIAREKAGIIKSEVPVVSGVTDVASRAVVSNVCAAAGSSLYQFGREIRLLDHRRVGHEGCPHFQTVSLPVQATVDVETPWRSWSGVPMVLIGTHQAKNAAIALGVTDVLWDRGWQIPREAAHAGMAAVRCPLRIEVLSHRPTVIADAAHNWASISALVRTLKHSFVARRRVLVFGTARDKDVAGHLRQLIPNFDTVILTQYLSNPRALPVQQLHQVLRTISTTPAHLATDPSNAWKLSQRLVGRDDLICITGSFFIAAEMRAIVMDDLQTGHDRNSIETVPPGQQVILSPD